MKTRKLFIPFVLGLGLALALALALSMVEGRLLHGGRLPVSRAADINDVDTTDDELNSDGDCSLREAIQAANNNTNVDACTAGTGDDIITLPAGIYTLTITGTGEEFNLTGDLDITDTHSLTITGAGPHLTIINGAGIDRVLDVRPGAGTVVISGVTVMGGNVTGYGGGIFDSGADLTLINTVVSSNTATANGGGIGIWSGSAVLSGVQVVSNTANNGGGVWINLGSGTLSGGQIRNNSANVSGGGMYVGTGSATLNEEQIISNTAGSRGGGVFINYGSAMISGGRMVSNTAGLNGGGVFVWNGSATLNGGQIVSNTADSYGGGVYLEYGHATLSGGQILSNSANFGGGVCVWQSSSVFTQTGGSAIDHNSATSAGGMYVHEGSAVLSGGQMMDNHATNSGGGVRVSFGRATLSGGQIVSNTAGGYGGGLYIDNVAATLVLVNTTVSRNAAGEHGGGLSVHGGTATLTYTTVASNTASGVGGVGIHNSGGAITVQNIIVAHNGVTNCVGGLTSNGYNLEDGAGCGFSATTDISDTDALLGPLAYDSGVWVHPLLGGSPAIDNGLCLPGLTTVDQRGVTRPQGAAGKCDVGAYELVPVAPASVSVEGADDGIVGESYTFTATVSPPTATLPLVYTWTPMPDAGQGAEVAAYSWTTPGTKTITVTVENVGGAVPVPATRDIFITDFRIYLPLVLRNCQ